MGRRRKGEGSLTYDRERKCWRARHPRLGSMRGSKTACQQQLRLWDRQQKSEGQRGQRRRGGQLTYGDLWALYEAERLPNKSDRTQRNERQAWKRIVRWTGEGGGWTRMRVEHLSTAFIDAYRVWQAKLWGTSALRLDLSLLRVMGNWAEQRGLCTLPPRSRAKWNLPKPPRRIAQPIEDADYERLLEAAGSPIQRAMLIWYAGTGARPSELTRLERASYDRKNRLVLNPHPKTDRPHHFPLTAELVQAIDERDAWLRKIAKQKRRKHLSCSPKQARARLQSVYLFPSKTGTRLSEGGYRGALKTAFDRAGLAYDFYSFRHRFVDRFLSDPSARKEDLAAALGTSPAMIDATYSHASIERTRKVLDNLASSHGDANKPVRSKS